MILLSLGKWSNAGGKYFLWNRIYWKGKWTPFCKIKKRCRHKIIKAKPDLQYDDNFYYIFLDKLENLNKYTYHKRNLQNYKKDFIPGFYRCHLDGTLAAPIIEDEIRELILSCNGKFNNEFIVFPTQNDVENFVTSIKILY